MRCFRVTVVAAAHIRQFFAPLFQQSTSSFWVAKVAFSIGARRWTDERCLRSPHFFVFQNIFVTNVLIFRDWSGSEAGLAAVGLLNFLRGHYIM